VFCPRCGAPHEVDAAFCERCGERLASDGAAAPAPPPALAIPAPSGGDRGGPRRAQLITGAVVAALAAVALVLVLTGAFAGHPEAGFQDVARAPTAAPATVPTVPATIAPDPTPTTETAPAPPKPAAPRSVRATVARTCGRNGVGGDCQLSVRARPAAGAAELRRLDEGDALRLSCQVRGDAVHSSALGASTTVWSRTTSGGYVSNAYVTGPRIKAQAITLRRC
jgi:hypothetical protein